MKGDKYHLVKLPMGWMILLAGERGLKRASLKPSPQEAVEDLGTELDGAEDDSKVFDDIVNRLYRYSAGEMAALAIAAKLIVLSVPATANVPS